MLNSDERLRAKTAGLKHFDALCALHGVQQHFTSSGRCIKCTSEAKDPAVQAQYWAAKRSEINARRRAKYAAGRNMAAFWVRALQR